MQVGDGQVSDSRALDEAAYAVGKSEAISAFHAVHARVDHQQGHSGGCHPDIISAATARGVKYAGDIPVSFWPDDLIRI